MNVAADLVFRWSTVLVVLSGAAIAQVSKTFTIVDMVVGVANVIPVPVSWGGLY